MLLVFVKTAWWCLWYCNRAVNLRRRQAGKCDCVKSGKPGFVMCCYERLRYWKVSWPRKLPDIGNILHCLLVLWVDLCGSIVTEFLFVLCQLVADCTAKLSIVIVRGELSYLAPLGSEKISAPYFKQCFFDWVKHHASQSQDRNNKYFILYIEFVAADLLFRLARTRHAWKGDYYLTVLVFSWQILFLLS